MKKILLLLLAGMMTACQSAPTPVVGVSPIPSPVPATATPSPSATPTPTICPPTSTPTALAALQYNDQFLQAIGVAEDSCLPDKTKYDVGVYIYDLTRQRELVSINADTGFQYASAFKAPVLVYFLSNCKKYWDVESPEWDEYFRKPELVRDEWYTSDEYKALIAPFVSDVNNWKDMEAFSASNRVNHNGADGPIDKRYYVLQQVYGMVARSSNPAAADVLRFVYDNCLGETPPAIEERCGGPNAITEFNAWFNEFAGITYEGDEPRRGLYTWDVVLEKDENGNYVETKLSTDGLKDACANQAVRLSCLDDRMAGNVMSARDFYRFYLALYNLQDAKVRAGALDLLRVDIAGPARANLKNMSRNMGAEAMSKNGYGYYVFGPIVADAGIVQYRGVSFVVVTLSYNALDAMNTLYGSYNSDGALVSNPGLIQRLLEENSQ